MNRKDIETTLMVLKKFRLDKSNSSLYPLLVSTVIMMFEMILEKDDIKLKTDCKNNIKNS